MCFAYRPQDVVAVLDSESSATEHEGFPLVRTVDEALRYDADDGARRGRDPGRSVPARVA